MKKILITCLFLLAAITADAFGWYKYVYVINAGICKRTNTEPCFLRYVPSGNGMGYLEYIFEGDDMIFSVRGIYDGNNTQSVDYLAYEAGQRFLFKVMKDCDIVIGFVGKDMFLMTNKPHSEWPLNLKR